MLLYKMREVRINIAYKKLPSEKWDDSEKRSFHIIDRMQLRGIGINNIKDAVSYGAKKLREDGSIVAEYRWYKVVYREFNLDQFKKIYPITLLFAEDET